MNSAKKLLQFNFDPNEFASRAPRVPAIPTKQLQTLEKIMEEHDDSGYALPDRESLHQVYQHFVNTPPNRLISEFNTLRRIRQLAWALTYFDGEPPRGAGTLKLRAALHLIENRFRISMLPGIFNALMRAWNTPNAGMLRASLKKHLTDYAGSRKSVQKLKENMAWYCEEDGTMKLAMYLITSRRKLSGVWKHLELPDYMHGYPYFGDVATEYTTYNNQLNTEHVTDVVNFIKKHDNDKTSRRVLSKLIEKLGSGASEDLRQPVQSYALQKWQDPRIAGADVRWREVSDKARQTFTLWITKEDLRFFFDVVAQACNDQKFTYRKTFWLAYLEHITFCRPILRKDVEYLFQHDQQASAILPRSSPRNVEGWYP